MGPFLRSQVDPFRAEVQVHLLCVSPLLGVGDMRGPPRLEFTRKRVFWHVVR